MCRSHQAVMKACHRYDSRFTLVERKSANSILVTSKLGFAETFLLSKVIRFYCTIVKFSFIIVQRNGAGFNLPEVYSSHKFSTASTKTTTSRVPNFTKKSDSKWRKVRKESLFIHVCQVYLWLQRVRILSRSNEQAENTDKISSTAISKLRISPNRFSWNLTITREQHMGIYFFFLRNSTPIS
jgi:hypothetical protein